STSLYASTDGQQFYYLYGGWLISLGLDGAERWRAKASVTAPFTDLRVRADGLVIAASGGGAAGVVAFRSDGTTAWEYLPQEMHAAKVALGPDGQACLALVSTQLVQYEALGNTVWAK